MKNRCYKRAFPFCAGMVLLLCSLKAYSQQYDCNTSYPVFKMGFGDDRNPVEPQLIYIQKNYSRTMSDCPEDGQYTFVSSSRNCFSDHWYSIDKDHTPGSTNGRMMLVNAAPDPSAFFTYLITGLKDNAHYMFSAWFLNVCRPNTECTGTLPRIRTIVTDRGRILGEAHTGGIVKAGPNGWQQLKGEFTLPAGTTSCLIFMENEAHGGCGNDFAMDDIEVRLCKIIETPKPALVSKPAANPAKKTIAAPPATQPATVKPVPAVPLLKKDNAVVKNEPYEKNTGKPSVTNPAVIKAVPVLLQTRTNVVAREIETPAATLEISLYDNGDIDGDTVSIYHNSVPLLLHQRLSDKPISFKINVTPSQPHHELVMVADNLGSIPPNTSVMIVTAAGNRWEISLSSSEKQNAKVVIGLKKE